jgi:membrane protein required for colicin V production
MAGSSLPVLDLAVAVLLALALVRGLWNGLLRESLSVASFVAAVVAVRFSTAPLGDRLHALVAPQLGPAAARSAAGVAIFVGVLIAGVLLARALRRGARAVGLGWLDRLGGGALGLAEGAVVAIVALLLAGAVLGRDHPAVSGSRAHAAAQRVREFARRERAPLPPVAAPPARSDARR